MPWGARASSPIDTQIDILLYVPVLGDLAVLEAEQIDREPRLGLVRRFARVLDVGKRPDIVVLGNQAFYIGAEVGHVGFDNKIKVLDPRLGACLHAHCAM